MYNEKFLAAMQEELEAQDSVFQVDWVMTQGFALFYRGKDKNNSAHRPILEAVLKKVPDDVLHRLSTEDMIEKDIVDSELIKFAVNCMKTNLWFFMNCQTSKEYGVNELRPIFHKDRTLLTITWVAHRDIVRGIQLTWRYNNDPGDWEEATKESTLLEFLLQRGWMVEDNQKEADLAFIDNSKIPPEPLLTPGMVLKSQTQLCACTPDVERPNWGKRTLNENEHGPRSNKKPKAREHKPRSNSNQKQFEKCCNNLFEIIPEVAANPNPKD